MTVGLAVIAVRSFLAVIFVVAGTAKLRDREGFGQNLRDFGLGPHLARWLRTGVPVAEITVAATLLSTHISWLGAWAALALLASFTVATVYNLSGGRTPECRCFGRQSRPIGWQTVARNGLLIVLALVLIMHGPAFSDADASSSLDAIPRWLVVVFATAFILLGVLTMQTLREHGHLMRRVEALEAEMATRRSLTPAAIPGALGLRPGTPAPSFELADLTGEVITLAALRKPGMPVLLVFTDPNCGPCNALLPDIARFQGENAEIVTLAVISRGTAGTNRPTPIEHGLNRVLLQRGFEVAAAYQALATPSAVLITSEGTIATPVSRGPAEVLALLTQVRHKPDSVAGPTEPGRVGIGDPAPSFALPDIRGRMISLSDLRGREILVLFWDPSSKFCERMLDDLRVWDANPRKGAPALLVVSIGGIDAAAAMSLRSAVVLEPTFSIARRFGAVGTPSAILVDAAGNVASAVAAGVADIFNLANWPQGRSTPSAPRTPGPWSGIGR
jgi:peroxiredoxin/uncharacterized membrane protein YphA (DoxX/SURF4 family)